MKEKKTKVHYDWAISIQLYVYLRVSVAVCECEMEKCLRTWSLCVSVFMLFVVQLFFGGCGYWLAGWLAGHWFLVSGFFPFSPRYQIHLDLERQAGNWKLETGNWKVET